jgi:hypothetical protein
VVGSKKNKNQRNDNNVQKERNHNISICPGLAQLKIFFFFEGAYFIKEFVKKMTNFLICECEKCEENEEKEDIFCNLGRKKK